VPISFLQDGGSIFQSESGSVDNITRANAMILNTGKGQVTSLISNVFANINGTTQYDNPSTTAFRSGYAPGYTNNKGEKAINSNIYAFYNIDKDGKTTIYPFVVTNPNDVIPEISYNRGKMIPNYGFKSPEESTDGFIAGQPNTTTTYNDRKINDIHFSWGSFIGGNVNANADYASINGDKKSLLVKTQKLFNSKGMKNIITVKGDKTIVYNSTQITTANADGISKGSAVLNGDLYDATGTIINKGEDAENTYCRSWTTINRYDTVSKMVRKSGLKETSDRFGNNYFRFNTEHSTLDDNGFVKIAPYVLPDDKYSDRIFGTLSDVKTYMFSIENLAWNDDVPNLPPVEQGVGDPLTGNRGRIMWFPPYNIQINESSSVSWETTNFIGRGEPVYTYNNTERSATLSFSVVVDHSSYMNSFRGPNGPSDNYVASFIAGCVDPSSSFANKLTVPEKSALAQSLAQQSQLQVLDNGNVGETTISVYFPNDVYDISYATTGGYEYGSGNGIGLIEGQVTRPRDSNGNPIPNSPFSSYDDKGNFKLNGTSNVITIKGNSYNGISDPAFIPALKNYMENECKYCKIDVYGYASVHGIENSNKELAEKRAESIIKYLKDNDVPGVIGNVKTKPLGSDTGCPKTSNQETINNEQCKKDRRAEILIRFDQALATSETVKANPVEKTVLSNFNPKIANRFYNEAVYFEKLKQTDKFVFDSFRDKIKYFHPAFHSTTPEGLNSRLTFLQQCTRQGPTTENINANNLAFGRPPICILRLGDFFHTKVIIDNLTIDYEPLVWDLNPEGIGVQPMIANVTLSLKLIGGSSLVGPINKLQNALSFNYYANTRVYDERADYIETRIITDRLSGRVVNGIDNVNDKREADKQLKEIADQQPVVAQELANEQALDDAAKKEPETPPSSGTSEAKVSGIGNIVVGNWGGEKHDIRVNLTFDGLTINSSEEEKNTFLSKGLKLTIENVLGQTIIEEIVVLSSPNYKSLDWLLSGGLDSMFGFYFGSIIESDSSLPKIIISSGSYVLKVKYDGGLVFKKMFIVI